MSTEITQNETASRFEIIVDGDRVGVALYRDDRSGDRPARSFNHTEIEDDHEGQGLAGRLVSAALDATRNDGFDVLPYCPYVRRYIEGHPEYLDLVPMARRNDFRLPVG
ncbi:MAG: GNAT family N-acetyltransferase [Acidimicrobiales bacterium]